MAKPLEKLAESLEVLHPLQTPYVNEADIAAISAGFSSDDSFSPWNFVNHGIDVYPQGGLKPFQASCAGVVDSVQLLQPDPSSNWRVEVLVQCDDYVFDLAEGGYFIPFSTAYLFETMSDIEADGQNQLANIAVTEGQDVVQGDIIGYLKAAGEDAHVQFGLTQFASSQFSALGVSPIPLCPEPHFATAARDSVLSLLHVSWPGASMCYQN